MGLNSLEYYTYIYSAVTSDTNITLNIDYTKYHQFLNPHCKDTCITYIPKRSVSKIKLLT